MWNSLPDIFVTVPIASCFKIKLDKFYCGFTVSSFYRFFVRFSCILAIFLAFNSAECLLWHLFVQRDVQFVATDTWLVLCGSLLLLLLLHWDCVRRLASTIEYVDCRISDIRDPMCPLVPVSSKTVIPPPRRNRVGFEPENQDLPFKSTPVRRNSNNNFPVSVDALCRLELETWHCDKSRQNLSF